jgi:four helix bundle protein
MFHINPLKMFLNLAHTKLDVFHATQKLALDCYAVSRHLPPDERFAMVQQLRRAALSVHLNLAEGCSRKSKVERSRFFEISRGSVIEIDTCLDLAIKLRYINLKDLDEVGGSIVHVFKLLSGMIKP